MSKITLEKLASFASRSMRCDGGDVVFFEPGEKHWHGASAQVGMVHIAITEAVDGKAVLA